VLAPLQRHLHLVFAYSALQPQNDLLGGLGLLVEDRLGLATVSGLLSVVTALSLCEEGSFSGLVLRHLMRGVLFAILPLAISAASLGDVDHFEGERGCRRSR